MGERSKEMKMKIWSLNIRKMGCNRNVDRTKRNAFLTKKNGGYLTIQGLQLDPEWRP